MIKGGRGGGNTTTGLRFEERIHLATAISKVEGLSVSEQTVYKEGKAVAQLFAKNGLYKKFLEPKGVNYKNFISKRLLPDEAILVGNTLFIIEMKFQFVAGSVDEKLQTCDFKRKQYVKLLSAINIDVEYIYVLNDWFKKDEYKDVLEYVRLVGCHYYFNEIPLNVIGL